MNTLIDNIITILKAAIASGSITAISAWKGIKDNDQLVDVLNYPYISVDDGGERVETINAQEAQWRIYSVVFEFAVFKTDLEQALTDILNLSNEIKTVLELQANRQYNGHVWGITIQPLSGSLNQGFLRGRMVTVEYRQLEDTYLEY
jgi:hypothetical protein